jgi:hypothetical protein
MFRNLLYSAFGILGSREAKALEQASLNPAAAQLEKLMEIISANAETVYGKEHKFGSIKTAADFQNAVPINEYDTLQPYITRVSEGEQNVLTSEMPFMFATTSGTTGARKLIPITRSYVKEFRRASVSSGYHLLRSFPGVAKGVTLSVFSPAEEGRTPADIPYGAISGRLYLEEPPLVKKYVSPLPYELFLIKDYESRYYTLLYVEPEHDCRSCQAVESICSTPDRRCRTWNADSACAAARTDRSGFAEISQARLEARC